jgi:hypothetical protein
MFSVQVEELLLKEFENVCTLRVRMPMSSDLSNPRNYNKWNNSGVEEQANKKT